MDANATDPRPCRGCSGSVRVAPEEVQRMVAEYLRDYPDALPATAEERARRLTVCCACPDLAYGTTCRHCGCLVAVRASLRDAQCPRPGDPRW